MIRKTISLPDEMGDYIAGRLQSGQYGNDSEYFRDLVRRDRERQEAIAAIQEMIDDSLASGVSPRTFDEIAEEARARAKAKRRAADRG